MTATVTTKAIARIVTGLKSGGQIAMPIIEAEVAAALDALYEATEMIKLELATIDEVAGTSEYALSLLSGEATARVCRIDRLYRMTYDSEGAETSRTLLSPLTYDIGLTTDETGTLSGISEVIALASDSPTTLVGGLLPVAVCAFGVDGFIPTMHFADAEIAVAGKAISMLAKQTGKPWSDTRTALAEANNFDAAVGRIRHKVLRANTSRGLAMKPQQFI